MGLSLMLVLPLAAAVLGALVAGAITQRRLDDEERDTGAVGFVVVREHR